MQAIPNDPVLERMALTAMVHEIDSVNDAIESLCEDDFLNIENKIFFRSMIQLANENKEISHYSLLIKLKENNSLEEVGGVQALSDLMQAAPTFQEFKTCIAPLKDLARKRSLIFLGREMISKTVKCQEPIDELLVEFQKKACSIGDDGKKQETKSNQSIYENFRDGMSLPEYIDDVEEKARNGNLNDNTVLSEYPRLDKMLGGFQNGSLTYIGARTSMGKTSFILNLMLNQLYADEPKKILFFSLEMPPNILFKKLTCAKSGVSYDDLEAHRCDAEELERFKYTAKALASRVLFYEDQTSLKISQVQARTRRLFASEGIDIIYIDYITKIRADSKENSKHLEVDRVSKGLQDLALELNIPIVCLAQLNRGVESRQDKRPVMSDFRECGSIEEDADNILLLYRPSYYDYRDKPGVMQVNVAKNRILGNLGMTELLFESGRLIELGLFRGIDNEQ